MFDLIIWLLVSVAHKWHHGLTGVGVSRILNEASLLKTWRCGGGGVKNYQKLRHVIYERSFSYTMEEVDVIIIWSKDHEKLDELDYGANWRIIARFHNAQIFCFSNGLAFSGANWKGKFNRVYRDLWLKTYRQIWAGIRWWTKRYRWLRWEPTSGCRSAHPRRSGAGRPGPCWGSYPRLTQPRIL